MKKHFLISLCIWAVLFDSARAEELTPEQLVAQLVADDFDARKSAAAKLEALGDKARAALERGASEGDVHLKTTAMALLGKLGRASLTLHVYDAAGNPVANSEGEFFEQLAHDEELVPKKFRTGDNGLAVLRLDRPGKRTAKISVKNWVSDEAWVTIAVRNGENHFFMPLAHGGTVTGKVLGADGQALENAEIQLSVDAGLVPELLEQKLLLNENNGVIGDVSLQAKSDAKGIWRAEHVRPGVYACVIKAEGYIPALAKLGRVGEKTVVTAETVRLKVRRSGRLQVEVINPDGKPMEKTNILIEYEPVVPATDDGRLAEALKKFKATRMAFFEASDGVTETDEKGIATRENIPAGKYVVRVFADQSGENLAQEPLIERTVEIKADETFVLKQEQQDLSAQVTGHIKAPDGSAVAGAGVMLIREETFDRLYNRSLAHFAPSAFNPLEPNGEGANYSLRARADPSGTFKISHVPAGKYLAILRHNETSGYVFGIEVKTGKSVAVPEIVWPGSKRAVSNPNWLIGTVLDDSGAPVSNAAVTFLGRGKRADGVTEVTGVFNFSDQIALNKGDELNGTLVIRAGGFRPLVMQGVVNSEKKYTLMKQEYGALKVLVTDAIGKPLPDVEISLRGQTQTEDGAAKPVHKTNALGIARLEGLVCGPRNLFAKLPDYFYPNQNVPVEVKANTTSDVTLVMEKNLKVNGTIRVPAGTALRSVMAYDESEGRFALASEDGKFGFEGVPAGVSQITPVGPGLVFKRALSIVIPKNSGVQKMINIPELELVKPHGLVLDCGKEYAKCQATLFPAGEALRSYLFENAKRTYTSSIDGNGRVEFGNLSPGSYQVSIDSSDVYGDEVSTSSPEPVAGPFESQAFADPAEMKAIKAVIPIGTGSASFRLKVTGLPLEFSHDDSSARFVLKLLGRANASEHLSELSKFVTTAPPPFVIGKKPEWFSPKVPNQIDYKRLPAGEYQLFACNIPRVTLELGLFYIAGQDEHKQIELAKFVVKDAEKTDLGEVSLDFSKLADRDLAREALEELLLPADRSATFEP